MDDAMRERGTAFELFDRSFSVDDDPRVLHGDAFLARRRLEALADFLGELSIPMWECDEHEHDAS